jgi:hypothetical protein
MGAVKEDSCEVLCDCLYGTVIAHRGGFYAAGAVDPAEGRRIVAQGKNSFFGVGVQVKAFEPCCHGSADELKKLLNRLSPRSGVQCGITMRQPRPDRLYPAIPQGRASDMQSRVGCRIVMRFMDRPR